MPATKPTAAQKKAAEEKAKTEADAEAQAKADAEAQAKADAEAKAQAKASEKLEYEVLEPLLHNGETYAPKEYVYLTAKDAERLVARSVIRLTGESE